MSTDVRAGRRTVKVRRPDKPLFDEGGETKADLAEYYARIAPLMLAQVRDRPVALQRFPDGIDSGGFFVKHPSTPSWVRQVETGHGWMMQCQDAATLVWCADQAAIEIHMWLSKEPNLGMPDRMVLDLDPPEATAAGFEACKATAWDVRAELDDLGLAAYVMTTGSKGLHVHSPLRPELTDQEVRDLAEAIADRVAARRPEERTTKFRKAARRGRLFVDYLRNGRDQLAVAPYSVRARPGAPVAAPITWEELDGLVSPRVFSLDLRREECPFAGMGRHARSPRKARAKLG